MTIQKLAVPESGQKMHWDESLLGFGCRVSQGGTRTFVVMHGRARQLTSIGRYPLISLSQARRRAKEILAEQVLGKVRAPTHVSFETAVQTFIDGHAAKPSTKKEYRRLLDKHFMPKLRKEPVERITTDRLARIIDTLSDTPSEARHAHKVAAALFAWVEARNLIERSPLHALPAPEAAPSRERILTDEELVTVWATAERHGTLGRIVRLLICLGSRRGEIAGLRWDWIADGRISWPGQAMKNGHPHWLPLCPFARSVIDETPRKASILFPARGHPDDRAFNGWSKVFIKFRESSGVQNFTMHDLRRTWSSRNAAWAPPHVLERALSHTSGQISGVAAIYNRYQYAAELLDCYQKWESYLTKLLQKERNEA
jgi:integrase